MEDKFTTFSIREWKISIYGVLKLIVETSDWLNNDVQIYVAMCLYLRMLKYLRRLYPEKWPRALITKFCLSPSRIQHSIFRDKPALGNLTRYHKFIYYFPLHNLILGTYKFHSHVYYIPIIERCCFSYNSLFPTI